MSFIVSSVQAKYAMAFSYLDSLTAVDGSGAYWEAVKAVEAYGQDGDDA